MPWLAIAMGAASTVIGIILTAMNAKSTDDNAATYLILGGILTAFGPVVLSHAISKQLGRREALAELHGHLDSVSMSLGQSVAALDQALRRNAAKLEEPHVTLSIVTNVVSNIEVQIGQLQKLIGTPFSAQSLLDTKEQLVALTGDLSKAVEGDDRGAALQVARNIEKAVRRLGKSPNEVEDASIRCPGCATQRTLSIGTGVGATAHTKCMSCGTSFNVHRDGDGNLFVRVVAGAPSTPANPLELHEPVVTIAPPADTEPVAAEPSQPKRANFTCPTCGQRHRPWVVGKDEQSMVLCVGCDSAIMFDPEGVVTAVTTYRRATVKITQPAGKGYLVKCPDCGESHRTRFRVGGDYIGFCEADKVVLQVTAANVAEHRQGALPIPVQP
ncbi:hypothetical protein [Microbacterium telephonicum]|uniref:Uncharacterized protein n=1 Tax=Microbacterium telephonicum TaxID=1714841 RepID=A0A498C9T1_9MICO|nr:hypothetical protein [Microbacterium telephonicum]RLK52495.1 hypothetical protein C7474_0436 [Microbacterium telephonicum]